MGSLIMIQIIPPGDQIQVTTIYGDVVLDPDTPNERSVPPSTKVQHCINSDLYVDDGCGDWSEPETLTDQELIFAQTVYEAYSRMGLETGTFTVNGQTITIVDTEANPDFETFLTATPTPVATEEPGSGGSSETGADLRVLKSVSSTGVLEGETAIYTVTVSNLGPETATAVQVQDTLPAGLYLLGNTPSAGSYDSETGIWTIGTMAADSSVSLSMTVQADQVDQDVVVTNTAQVSSATDDPESGNNIASRTLTLYDTAADVAVSKTVADDQLITGDTTTFTLTVTNNGPALVDNLTISDVLPDELTFLGGTPSAGNYDLQTGDWRLGELDVDESASFTMTVEATEVEEVTVVTNTASVTGADLPDPDLENNSASVDVTISPPSADLSIVKTVSDNQNLQRRDDELHDYGQQCRSAGGG